MPIASCTINAENAHIIPNSGVCYDGESTILKVAKCVVGIFLGLAALTCLTIALVEPICLFPAIGLGFTATLFYTSDWDYNPSFSCMNYNTPGRFYSWDYVPRRYTGWDLHDYNRPYNPRYPVYAPPVNTGWRGVGPCNTNGIHAPIRYR